MFGSRRKREKLRQAGLQSLASLVLLAYKQLAEDAEPGSPLDQLRKAAGDDAFWDASGSAVQGALRGFVAKSHPDLFVELAEGSDETFEIAHKAAAYIAAQAAETLVSTVAALAGSSG